MKKYLVTGGNGFIGSHLTKELLDLNKEVFVLTEENPSIFRIQDCINKIRIVECDIRNKNKLENLIKQVKPDIIFHLAGSGINPNQNDIRDLFEINFLGTVNLLEACKKNGFECFINTGTASEYGNHEEPLEEKFRLDPIDNYSLSKASATLYCQKEAYANSLPIYTARLFCAYGEFEHPHRLIPTVIKGSIKNEVVELSSPNNVRDFIYVKDIANFYINLADKKPFSEKIFNVGTGVETTIQKVILNIENILNKKTNIKCGSNTTRPWEFKNWQANINLAKSILNWQPKHFLEDGLEKTIDWYLKQERYENSINNRLRIHRTTDGTCCS